uniref:Uncharacterized protein n=1 Tax=Lepeophtheirus salmonis TaxID=72036 RepID=A0A0K2VHM3_LEPSM
MKESRSHINNNEFINAPILVRSVREIPPNDDGYFPLLKLFHCNLKGVRLSFQLYHDRSTHSYLKCSGS